MKAFSATLERQLQLTVDRPNAQSSHPDTLGYFGQNFLFKYQNGTKSASLEKKLRKIYVI